METKTKRLFAISSLLVFFVGAVLFVSAFAERDYRPTPRPCKVTYILSQATGAAALEPIGLVERLVTADGCYRESAKGFDGKGWVKVANTDGVFTQQNGEAWQFLSNFKNQGVDLLYRSKKFLKNHPQLARTESVLGYEAYVLWAGDGAGGIDQWFAPEFGNTPLKIVIRQEGFLRITEAVKIEYVDVAASQVAITGPVRFESAEQRAADYRGNGDPTRAGALEESIQQAKATQKE